MEVQHNPNNRKSGAVECPYHTSSLRLVSFFLPRVPLLKAVQRSVFPTCTAQLVIFFTQEETAWTSSLHHVETLRFQCLPRVLLCRELHQLLPQSDVGQTHTPHICTGSFRLFGLKQGTDSPQWGTLIGSIHILLLHASEKLFATDLTRHGLGLFENVRI